MPNVIGWDVGGAHLKAAMLDHQGHVQQVLQVPCPLWRGLAELTQAIQMVIDIFAITNAQATTHAITMTGELVDLFANRREGVLAISRQMEQQLSGDKYFYTGAQKPDLAGFVKFEAVSNHWQSIASANWLATAAMAAQCLKHKKKFSSAILIDIGSTTTDFIAIKNHVPHCRGFTDAARMQAGELLYMGVVRTPLMALTQDIEFQGQMTSIAAEHFATTADVYRLTGDLNKADDMAETADGMDKTALASCRRLARMIGRDVEEAHQADWLNLANAFKAKQLARLAATLEKHLTGFNGSLDTVILSAGAGHFLVEALAKTNNLPYRNAATLLNGISGGSDLFHKTSTCLPAAAVAYLAHQTLIYPNKFKASEI
jgi:probable H4MPT-linked C1 transfer pathway protein